MTDTNTEVRTEEPHLLFEREGHTAIVTLNRPAKKNALSGEMLVLMHDAWNDCSCTVRPLDS